MFFVFSGWQRYLKLELIDLRAWRVLLVHFFLRWKYDLAAKKCPHKVRFKKNLKQDLQEETATQVS